MAHFCGDIVHHILLLTFDGKLCLSPKNENAKSVLDMGTGTGAWAIDFGVFISQHVYVVRYSILQPFSRI
jgi:hypothetical protein